MVHMVSRLLIGFMNLHTQLGIPELHRNNNYKIIDIENWTGYLLLRETLDIPIAES